MKMTLLDIVQDILNDMDGDVVDSIDDTVESEQVAQIVKSTYYSIINNRNWPHTKQAITITQSGGTARPTYVTVNEDIKELLYINYNCAKNGETRKLYTKMKWLETDDFLRVTNNRNNDNSNVDVIQDVSGIELLIYNDRAPTYFTSFDDETIIFDSYDITVDSTIQASKMQAEAYVIPSWTHSNTFIPDLPSEAFTALLEEAKSRAMFKLKQTNDVKAEQESRRQQRWLSRKAFTVKGGVKYPNYGRNSYNK